MKVVVDAHMLGHSEGGNETYVAGLLEGFSQLGRIGASVVTALVRPSFHPASRQSPGVRYKQLQFESDIHRLLFGLRRACVRSDADILHSTYISPPALRRTVALSVHDVIFRSHPKFFSPRDRLLLSLMVAPSIRRARVVLTLSEASRRKIARYYPGAGKKTRVVGLAPGQVATVQPNRDAAGQIVGGKPFILAVGTLQPRKNIQRLVEAYAANRLRGQTEAKLVIVGRSRWKSSSIAQAAEHYGLTSDVIFAGYQPQEVLSGLYRLCDVFVYPSLAEGFGLPILEAMACGAPVIASDREPMSELAQGAAILIDPESTDQLTEAMAMVSNDRDLQSSLREQGLARSSQFSWRQTAQETIEAYTWALR